MIFSHGGFSRPMQITPFPPEKLSFLIFSDILPLRLAAQALSAAHESVKKILAKQRHDARQAAKAQEKT